MGWLELIINIKPSCGEGFKNGASNGIGLEPYCIEFAELTIHNMELMEQVNSFLCA